MRVLLLLAASACAFAQIERPQIGVMLDRNGDARPVTGTAASATLGDPIWHGVLSMACSERGCLAKTSAQVVSTDGAAADAPTGAAIFGGSYVYFADSQQLARWRDGTLEPVPIVPDGVVLALRAHDDSVDFAIERGGATWIERVSLIDSSVSTLASFGPAAAAILRDGITLLTASDGVHLLRANGSDTVLPVSGVQAFVAMSPRYVELVTPQGMWAFDLEQDALFLLPGVAGVSQ